uniref:NADH-ubiquinone oxidoreductase chain 3 n=1 Tax=Tetraleurodes acaciae TaxID=267835 RepID=Q674P1_TETAA|nr:NADH dehydrogenase subunit 3 [Tetraleurodes acaciae]AAU14158.1 NADH dehydrogenase subunit 3 [Tetraleurodes acaciae]
MMLTFIYLTILLIIVLILSLISTFINIKLKFDREKFSVFECGFDLLSILRLPFSINFYFVTIIFLIFDVELTLLLPFIFNMKSLAVSGVLMIMLIFFLILIAGFVYEWAVGLLNWFI